MSQTSLWQNRQPTAEYAELCNALYERELRLLANNEMASVNSIQGRLKSLSYYINRTAHLMTQVQSPLSLDVQNASWSAKQNKKMPITSQTSEDMWLWYQSFQLFPGLVVVLEVHDHFVIDCIDRVDGDNNRFRTNANGWFNEARIVSKHETVKLMKPNKKIMSAACAGHRWNEKGPISPVIPSLRELLLTCSINWRNFKLPVT